MFGPVGLFSTAAGFALGAYLTVDKLIFANSLSGRPILFLAILLVITGVQLITMGLLGEMMVRIYHEGQHKPVYVIKDILE
jgi:hypothetical protein